MTVFAHKLHDREKCTLHRRLEGGGNLGQLPPPLEFENDDVIRCSRGKYPKIFARALGARIKYP